MMEIYWTHISKHMYIFNPTTYRFSIWNLYNQRAKCTFILAIVLCVSTILNKQKGPKVIFLCRGWGGNDFRVIEKPIVRKFLFFHLKYKYILCLVRVHTFVDIFLRKAMETKKNRERSFYGAIERFKSKKVFEEKKKQWKTMAQSSNEQFE